LFELKGYKAFRDFPNKGWNVRRVYKLLQITGSDDHRPGSGRWHSARTADNINFVDEL